MAFDTDRGARIDRVLVVDDNAQNRQLVEAILVTSGYSVALSDCGEQALAILPEYAPDLVLLDVLMPGMDGFETCGRIRAMPAGADVGVVFVTALNDLGSHQKAMASGADDFLTKPLNRTELLMRVRSLLWVKRLKDQIKSGYELIRSQRDALLSSQRQKDELTALIVHDLKNPLSAILANADFLTAREPLTKSGHDAVRDIGSAAQSMLRMILNLLDISRSEDGRLVPQWSTVEVDGLLEELRSEIARRASERSLTIEVLAELGVRTAKVDRDLLRRLLENLLDNAIRYSPTGGRIGIEARSDGSWLEFRVRDDGIGVPEPYRESVFDKYVQVDRAAGEGMRTSRGLGLTFCRLAAEIHGGRIWIEENRPSGSVFCVRLPSN